MSTNLKSILVVVAISIAVSLLSNLFLGIKTESSVWKKTSVEAIYEVGYLRNADKNAAVVLQNMVNDLEALKDEKVSIVLKKYRTR